MLRLPRGADADPVNVANRLHEDPLTIWAHPNYVAEMEPLATVTDPLYPSQWHLESTGQRGAHVDADVDAEAAWDTTFGSSAVVIAVLDDGVEILHEDLASQIHVSFRYDLCPTCRTRYVRDPLGPARSGGRPEGEPGSS